MDETLEEAMIRMGAAVDSIPESLPEPEPKEDSDGDGE